MSSKQLTLADVSTETTVEPESPDIGEPKSFNREGGRERTELGADLDVLVQRAREGPSRNAGTVRLPGDAE